MRFEIPNATYLLKAVTILTTPQPPDVIDPIRPYLTNTCPECGEVIDIFDEDGGHAVVSDGNDGTGAYVLIGCEGYLVVNPAALGITTHPNWQDWTKLADDVTPDDFADELHRKTCQTPMCPKCFPRAG